jgi:pimeloyl-ACP methyl ester carboxylesterase
MRLLDAQPWKGQARFRSLKYQNWFYTNGKLDQGSGGKKGGTWKGDEKLRLYTVDEAGHFSAMNQPEALGAVVADWLRK